MKLLILLAAVIGALAIHPDALERQRIINEVNSDPTSTWTAGVNPKFADSTYDHVKSLCGVLPGGPEYPPEREFTEDELNMAVPDDFDAREQWPHCPSLTELRDQSSCGSCWAMGGIAAATDRVCIQTNGTVKDRLSAEDLVGCCRTCGMGCNGGYPSAVWSWFKNTGVVTGGEYHNYTWCSAYSLAKCDHHCTGKYGPCPSSEYPTPKCPRACDSQSSYRVAFSDDKHKFKTDYSVRGVAKIQKDLMTHGPGEVSFTVYADFEAYTGGVYQHKTGSQLGGHAVKFIGWGVDAGTPYWWVANSWNEDWGEKGFFRIIRGQDECGIESSYVTGDYK